MVERPLSVVQMLPALEAGGVERGTLEVAGELARLGHRSIVISGGGRLVSQLIAGGSEHVTWPVGRKSLTTLLLVRRLRCYLRDEKIDILHVRSRVPAWLGWLAWRGMDAACRPHFVTTVHGLYSVNAYSRIMTRGERVIAVSDTARDYITTNYPEVDPQKIVTIYRGVDPRDFPFGFKPADDWIDAWYATYPFLRNKKVLTLPGRMTRLKGHEDFIELVGKLIARGLPVHGLIVGHLDPKRKKYIAGLQQEIAARGLVDRVTFPDHRADIREIYSCSDIVLSLSRKPESFGRTTLETLGLGIPVVGYDHGGVGEILARIYPQGRVPLDDMRELVETVTRLLERPQPVPRSDNFRLEEMLDQTLQLYRGLVS